MDFRTATYWHQGLFLQPQHFQRQELHQQFLKKPLFDLIAPHFWGVGELECAPESLSTHTVEVRRARLIFAQNTYVEFPGNAVIPPRSFDKVWTNTDQPLDVYLGLKKFSIVTPNATVVDSFSDAAAVQTRYISEANGQPTPGFYGEGPTAHIPVVLNAVRIFFGPELESLDEYDLIPIGSLIRDNETVKLSTDSVPPCYAMSGSQALQDLVRDIRDDMSGRMRQLAEYKTPRDMLHQDLDADFFILMQSLQALNRMVPTLIHLTETDQIHPWEVYGTLRQCVGEISTFSDQYDAVGRRRDTPGGEEGLPPYDHQRLYACFHAARRLINRLLSEISVGPEFRVTLEPQDNYLVGAIPREYFGARNRFYLVIQSSEIGEDSGQDFLRVVRLATPEALPKMIDHALPGIDMIEVSTPPQGMPKRTNARYFRIEQMSDEWELIEQAAEIDLFWPEAPADLRAQIVILRG